MVNRAETFNGNSFCTKEPERKKARITFWQRYQLFRAELGCGFCLIRKNLNLWFDHIKTGQGFRTLSIDIFR